MRLPITGFVLLLLSILVISVVSAVPVLPHAFIGDVMVNGAPAPDGTQVSATISSGTLILGTQNPVSTIGGSFGKGNALPLLVQGEIGDGAVITFFVNGVNSSTTSVFEAGGGPTVVSLSVITDATPLPTQAASPVSSGGGDVTTVEPTQIPEETVAPEVAGSAEASSDPAPSLSTVATTTAQGTTPIATPTQKATEIPVATQAPLGYAPCVLVAGGVLFFVCMKRD
jgi:hypothetical protein